MSDGKAAAPEITVRFNRTAAASWLVFGTAMLLATVLYDLMSDRRPLFQYGGTLSIMLTYFVAIGCATSGATQLIRSHYFTYRPDIETLVVNGGRTYPRSGYRWIGRTQRGAIVEFGPGGAFHRIPVSRSKADIEDWKAFVDEIDLIDGNDPPDPSR
ncbi:hypothetical protein [Glycomyces sp. NPDC021274]|uniref:hypothetical protein n=1 Tax=Glycomyces sp. NPDC021274 TaxID=3155120 RepID=UPI0033CB21B1